MSADFSAILNQRADTVEPPARLPRGKFESQVGKYDSGVSDQKKTKFIEFQIFHTRPLDVKPEDFDQAQKALSKGPVEDSITFYLTDRSLYRLIEFLERDCGISKSGKTISEMIMQATGKTFSSVIDLVPSKKDGKEYPNIVATGPLG